MVYSEKTEVIMQNDECCNGGKSRSPKTKCLAWTWGQKRSSGPVTSKLRDKLQLDEDYFKQRIHPQKSSNEEHPGGSVG